MNFTDPDQFDLLPKVPHLQKVSTLCSLSVTDICQMRKLIQIFKNLPKFSEVAFIASQ